MNRTWADGSVCRQAYASKLFLTKRKTNESALSSARGWEKGAMEEEEKFETVYSVAAR